MAKYWFDHVHIVSKDPAKTTEFYEANFTKEKTVNTLADGRVLISLSMGGPSIKISNPRQKPLIPSALPGGCGLEHFGIRTDNIEQAVAEMKTKGIKFVQEITQVRPGTRVAFFVSPEDVLIELLEMK